MTTSQFFFTQFSPGRTPSLPVQRQALAFADRTGNTALISRIASCEGIDAAIDAAIGERDELDVLLAWSTRPRRSTEELVERFSREKRATLLVQLAEARDLPEQVYRQLGTSSAVTVRWGLLTNPSVPEDLKVELASDLGARYMTTNSSVYDRANVLLAQSPTVIDAFIASSVNRIFLYRLVRMDSASSAAVLAASRRALALAADDFAAFEVIAAALDRDSSGDLADFVRSEVVPTIERLEKSEVRLGYGASQIRDSLDRARRRVEFDLDAALERIASAPTPAAIASEVDQLRREARSLGLSLTYEAIAHAVICNPHVDAAVLSSYLGWLEVGDARQVAARAVHNKDRELASLIFGQFSFHGADLFSEFYEQSGDPEEFLVWAIGSDAAAPAFILHSRVVSQSSDLAFRLLPLGSVLTAAVHAERAEQLVVEALGDDEGMWVTFATLANEWSGSLSDLLAVVASFGATAALD